MHKILKILVIAVSLVCVTQTYAIQVNVKSHTKVDGLGFTVQGVKHGGAGHTYTGTNMPKGQYNFGVRINGRNVPCKTPGNKQTVNLSKNTTAVLIVKNAQCTLKIK